MNHKETQTSREGQANPEKLEPGSDAVIGLLREFNFGNRRETARQAVERFLEFNKNRPGDDPEDLVVEALTEAGFAKGGMTSYDDIKESLDAALADYEGHSEEWQKEVAKNHKHMEF